MTRTDRQHCPLILLITLTMVLTLWPRWASGQTTCDPPKQCASKRLIQDMGDRAARNICAEALTDRDAYRTEATGERKAREFCEGRLLQAQIPDPVIVRKSPWPLRRGLELGAAIGGGALGYSIGAGGSPELVIGLAVGEFAIIGARFLVGYLDDRLSKK